MSDNEKDLQDIKDLQQIEYMVANFKDRGISKSKTIPKLQKIISDKRMSPSNKIEAILKECQKRINYENKSILGSENIELYFKIKRTIVQQKENKIQDKGNAEIKKTAEGLIDGYNQFRDYYNQFKNAKGGDLNHVNELLQKMNALLPNESIEKCQRHINNGGSNLSDNEKARINHIAVHTDRLRDALILRKDALENKAVDKIVEKNVNYESFKRKM